MDQSVGFKKRILIFQLAEELTRDFILEGWLKKMGPRNEPFKKRFFTLDKRKLMYLEEPLVNIGPLKIDDQTMKVVFFWGGGEWGCCSLYACHFPKSYNQLRYQRVNIGTVVTNELQPHDLMNPWPFSLGQSLIINMALI